MRTLIRKELRENLKLAVPALLIFVFVLVHLYQNCTTQPLLAMNVLTPVELFCSLLGLALGWFQIHHERHCDLWAFLIHRPLTRTEIFLAKVTAGLGLYLLAAGLPLLGLIAASAMPGQFASPFEWAMVLPVGGIFLTGMVWYFAGLLTGLRSARWFASRGLGLTAALLISMLAGIKPSWLPGSLQEYVVLAIGGAILATGAWGAFHADGSFRGQPAWGRRALVVTLTLGVIAFSLLAESLLETFLLREHSSESAHHEITRDGTIYEVVQRDRQPAEIRDLAGAPLKDPETGHEMSLAKFDKLVADNYPINVDFGDQSEVRNLFQPDTRFFSLWQITDRVNWYWKRNGQLAGYDAVTRRLVGSIAPDNFPGPTGRFLRPQLDGEIDPDGDSGPQNLRSASVFATPTTVYKVKPEDRTVRALFTTANDDPIGAARSIADDKAFIVVTRNFIQMITMDGKSVWKAPYQSAYPGSMWVKVSELGNPHQFAVWVGSYQPVNRQNKVDRRRYSRMLLVSSEQGVVKEIKLKSTSLNGQQVLQTLGWRLGSLLLPPCPFLYKLLGWRATPWDMLGISFGMAALCALVGWLLGRRYNFPIGTQVGWAVFHLLSGLPGFVAFLSVQEWPAREKCPSCKKMRVVERARCEHCEAAFAPAEKNGTEIFEPLTVA